MGTKTDDLTPAEQSRILRKMNVLLKRNPGMTVGEYYKHYCNIKKSVKNK